MSRDDDGLRSVTSPDGTVVLDLRHDRLLGLNPSAGTVWGLLRDGASVDAVAQHLARRHQIDPRRVHRDVRRFVEALAALGVRLDDRRRDQDPAYERRRADHRHSTRATRTTAPRRRSAGGAGGVGGHGGWER